MLGGFVRRFTRLYRLLWMDERVSSLEGLVSSLEGRVSSLEGRVSSLEGRADHHQVRLGSLQRQVQFIKRSQKRQDRLLELVADRADVLKSSLEVPDELVDEFHAWRASNPVPDRPLVTVVIATYNRAGLLTQRSVPSVLNQTYDNLELVVVGDGCTDETEVAMRRIDDPRLTFLNLHERSEYPEEPERRWMVAGTPALNKGLSMATGHYITHLDDDDEYLPDRLEKLVRFAAENGHDFVWHPFFWQHPKGEWKVNDAPRLAHTQVTTSSVLYRNWFKNIPWDIKAHQLLEPGDWNRFRRIKYMRPAMARYPEPLLKHYRERNQVR